MLLKGSCECAKISFIQVYSWPRLGLLFLEALEPSTAAKINIPAITQHQHHAGAMEMRNTLKIKKFVGFKIMMQQNNISNICRSKRYVSFKELYNCLVFNEYAL